MSVFKKYEGVLLGFRLSHRMKKALGLHEVLGFATSWMRASGLRRLGSDGIPGLCFIGLHKPTSI